MRGARTPRLSKRELRQLAGDAARERQRVVLWLVRTRGYTVGQAEREYDRASGKLRLIWRGAMEAAAP
jgi:hypothetical protein